MPDSYPTSWKEPYRQALKESDEQKLTELVQAAEYAIVLRLQELENSTDHHEERIEMKLATADLLVIKTYKLGWPSVQLEFSGPPHRATARIPARCVPKGKRLPRF